MNVAYHPAVRRDVREILRHYDGISTRLGDGFSEELLTLIEAARANPERFHPAHRGLRRANMQNFPYHFLYRIRPDGIRVIVVRHHERHPSYGAKRI
jgi:plasmid stabilization system protein ParE